MKTKKYQLKNGLTVILVESRKSPVVSVQAWVRTGSADEENKEKGLSHFIEHLLFKGTEKYKPGEVAQVVEGSGGEFNAYTSFDQTVFYVTISSEFSGTALDVISQMVGFPSFIESEVDSEREVVVEEIKRGMDNPGRQLSQSLFSTVYKKHNYKHPVIGYEKIVRGTPVRRIKTYYDQRYGPKNMFLVIAGDFESKEMKKEVEKYFGVIESTKINRVKRTKEPLQERTRTAVNNSEFKETSGYFAWPIPGAKSKDIPALDVLSLILGQGDSSRLVKKVRLENQVVNSVGAMAYTPTDYGIFAISYGLNYENFESALDMIGDEIIGVLAAPPSAEELQKAVTNLQSEEFYSLETVDGIARKVGTFEFLFKDPDFLKEYNKNIQNLTPKDILRVAKKYLKPEKMSMVVMSPEPEDVVKVALKGFHKSLKNKMEDIPRVKPGKKSEKKAKPLKFKAIRSGDKGLVHIDMQEVSGRLRVIFAENAESHVTSVKLAAPGGLISEPENRAGLSELLGRCWASGTENYSENEIAKNIEDIAGSLHGFSGRNSLGLSFEALSCFEQQGGELLFEVLGRSVFPKEILDRESQIMLEQIKNREDSPTQVCMQQFNEAMFEGHPYARDVLGTSDSIDQIDRESVLSFAKSCITPESSVLAVSGRADRDYWLEMAEKWCDETEKQKSEKWVSTDFNLDASQTIYSELQREQSHLIVGYPGQTLTSKKRYKLSVLQAILAGQGGRLFIELRDKASLAYTVAPLRFEGIDRGYFGAYIGCSPDKVNKAYEMMKEEFSKISQHLVSDEELERAKSYLIGKHDIGLQRSGSIAYTVLFDEFYGNPMDSLYNYSQNIKSVTSEDVRTLADSIFSQNEIRSLVGVENPFG